MICEALVYSTPFSRKILSCGLRPETENMFPSAELDPLLGCPGSPAVAGTAEHDSGRSGGGSKRGILREPRRVSFDSQYPLVEQALMDRTVVCIRSRGTVAMCRAGGELCYSRRSREHDELAINKLRSGLDSLLPTAEDEYR